MPKLFDSGFSYKLRNASIVSRGTMQIYELKTALKFF